MSTLSEKSHHSSEGATVLFLNPAAQLGGAEVALLTMCTGLGRLRPDLSLVALLAEDGPLRQKLEMSGTKVIIHPLAGGVAALGDASAAASLPQMTRLAGRIVRSSGGLLRYVARLRKIVAEVNPTIIHSNGMKMHALSALLPGANGLLIWHLHDFVSSRPVMSRALGRLCSRPSLMIANSASVKRDMERVCPEARIEVLWNGVDLTRFRPAEADRVKDASAVTEKKIRVGLLATMASWKGHAVFLEALSLLPHDMAIEAFVVGGALYKTRGSQTSVEGLKTLARQLSVDDRVTFVDFMEDVSAMIRSLDVVVHASTRPEPFGLVIVEAMASGVPVVISDAGGAAEIAALDDRLLRHVPGDAKGLAEAIERLCRDPKLRAELGVVERDLACRYFSDVTMASRLSELYDDAVRRRSARPASQ